MRISTASFAILFSAGQAAVAATFVPDPVLDSQITLRLEEVARVAEPGANNIASPVAIGDDLYVVDQTGRVLRQEGAGFEEVLGAGNLPAGVSLSSNTSITNIAGTAEHVFIALRSDTVPDGVTDIAPLPDDPRYRGGLTEVVYRFDRAEDGSLSNPEALTAFETGPGHVGGGMVMLDTGQVAYARGDYLPFNLDGLSAPQDDVSNVGRIFLIDGVTGDTEVAAQGIRNVQRMTCADANCERIAFADFGAETAEEINVISVADLVDTSTVENFGWGRNEDGNAREGSFYINEGAGAMPGARPEAIGEAPLGEAGFLQPYAQFGQEDVVGRFGVSGPVFSDVSFETIDLLFGDLVSGALFATVGDTQDLLNDVFRIALVDENGDPIALNDFTDGGRVDARFFNFADGGAGVLLERTGQLFRLTEVVQPIPLPASGLMLIGGLVLLARRRR